MNLKERIKKFIPEFLLEFYHYCLALLGAIIFGFPSRKLIVIGVTGTSGKSTTVDFITRILEEAGNKVASISSIRLKIGSEEWENKYKMTMPGRLVIQRFLRRAKKAGCKYVVLEVTSEGIRQFRHKFINFDTVVFTNLSPEHIESHKGFENYRNTKLKLFKENRKVHIININDENATYFTEVSALQKIGFKIKGKEIKCDEKRFQEVLEGEIIDLKDKIKFKVKNETFVLNLFGNFNIFNALAAIATAYHYGIPPQICSKALQKVNTIPGRMEVIFDKSFKVVVDYAHTPVQLEEVYKTLSKNEIGKKLICVLGSCGGGRDKWKRPVLGKIAREYCKEIIITNEDPYDEDPMEIINQIAEGSGKEARKILDRKEAIKKAIDLARDGDIVVITGKGAEPWMCVANGKKIPWDDRIIAINALREKGLK